MAHVEFTKGSRLSGSLFILGAGIFLGSLFYGSPSISQNAPPPTITLLDIERSYLGISKNSRAAVVEITVSGARIIFGEKHPDELSMSGTVWDDQGHIVTLTKGLKRGSQIMIKPIDTLSGTQKAVPATWLGSDEETGLALLKAELKGRVTVLKHRSATSLPKLQPGSLVVTVGNPFGFRSSVRLANIAGLQRRTKVGDVSTQEAMQLTVPVNPGDPGGVVVDARGEMIGLMVSSLRNRGGRGRPGNLMEELDRRSYSGAQGIGFAIPSSVIETAIARIRAQKVEKKAWLGVEVRNLSVFTIRDRKRLGLEGQTGIIIFAIAVGSPAEKAGLRSGDLIQSWGETKIKTLKELAGSVGKAKIGSTVKVVIIRQSESKELTIELK
jgi:S1-C subfamily serine protease